MLEVHFFTSVTNIEEEQKKIISKQTVNVKNRMKSQLFKSINKVSRVIKTASSYIMSEEVVIGFLAA